jgi:HEAT repeat protein
MKVAQFGLVGILLFVPACLKEVPKVQGKSANYWMGELKSPNYVVRARAANAVGNLAESAKAAIPDLIELLEDPESLVRWAAAAALARFGAAASEALPILDKMAETEHAPPARDAAENSAKIIRRAMKESS